MQRKTIITCAITGDSPVHPRYPAELNFPITPAQIAEAAAEATRAGASIIHIHARNPQTGESSRDPALYKEIVDRIRDKETDVVINLTCGHGAVLFTDGDDELGAGPDSDVISVDERVEPIELARPEMCSLDVTTANQIDGGRDYIYYNPSPMLRRMAARFQAVGVKPELECFGPGDVLFGRKLIEEGLIDGTPVFQFVLDVKWGAPATPETMIYLKGLLPPDAQWCGFGISRQQMPMVAQAQLLGGNVRVGLEDNLYLRSGVFATNPQLVERAIGIIDALGGAVATAQEARDILGLTKQVI